METIKQPLQTIVEGTRMLDKCTLKGVDSKERHTILRAMRIFKPIAEDFEGFIKTCQEKLKDEDVQKVEEKAKNWANLSEEERVQVNNIWNGYQKSIEDCVGEELRKEIELTPYDRLTEDGFNQLLDANQDWTVNQILVIESLLS